MLWLNGQIIDNTVAPFDFTDRGLTLGDGVFDTALALNGRIVFEDQHRERLVAGAKTLGFTVESDQIRDVMRALAVKGPRLVIRTTVTRGIGSRGIKAPLKPSVSLFGTASPVLPASFFEPITLYPTKIRRNETSPAARIKTLNYLDAILATDEAVMHGYDEAIFLNTKGNVTCTGVGNIFALYGDHLITPRLTDGVLDGTMRSAILGTSFASILQKSEQSFGMDTLLNADAVLSTNSVRLASPVTKISTKNFDSQKHPVVIQLIDVLKKEVFSL